MPPETPSTIRRPARLIWYPPGSGLSARRVAVGLGLAARVDPILLAQLFLGLEVRDDQALGDLLEGDRQGLAGDRGDLGRDGTLTVGEAVVVGVDLPSARGAQGDEGELRSGSTEELLDPGVDHRVVAGGHRCARPLGAWGVHRR